MPQERFKPLKTSPETEEGEQKKRPGETEEQREKKENRKIPIGIANKNNRSVQIMKKCGLTKSHFYLTNK